MREFGQLAAVEYWQSGTLHRHQFAPAAAPELRGDASRLETTGGDFAVTGRGIEDAPTRRRTMSEAGTGTLIKYVDRPKESAAMQFLGDFAVVGTVAALSIAAGAYLMRRTGYTYAARGALQGVVLIGTGVLAAKKYPRIALGAATAGVTAAVKGAVEEAQMRSYLGPTTSTNNLNTGSNSVNPGQGLPAGRMGGMYRPVAPTLPVGRAA